MNYESKYNSINSVTLGSILAFVAGAINAGGFIVVGRYTSHMTGITSEIADDLAIMNYKGVLISFISLLTFICGAAFSSFVINLLRSQKLQNEFSAVVLIEAVLLFIFGILCQIISKNSEGIISFITFLLCFIMGLQNAIITKISKARIRTTHVTGIVTDIGIEMGKILLKRSSKFAEAEIIVDKTKLRLHLQLLFLFILGGVVGAFSFKFYGTILVIFLSILLFLLSRFVYKT